MTDFLTDDFLTQHRQGSKKFIIVGYLNFIEPLEFELDHYADELPSSYDKSVIDTVLGEFDVDRSLIKIQRVYEDRSV